MKKIKAVFKKILRVIWRLTCALVVGAINETKETHNLNNNDWKEFIKIEIREYFAPLTGAFKGIRKELHQLFNKDPN